MSFAEVLHEVRSLPRSEQADLMHLLQMELSEPKRPCPEDFGITVAGEYPIATPFGCQEAAAELARLMETRQGGQ